MPNTSTLQFFIREPQFLAWTHKKKDLPKETPITHKVALETLYGTVFPQVDDFMVSFSAENKAIFCDDVDLLDGERSIEIVRTEPDPESLDSIFQVTLTDTVGKIENAEAILRRETLLGEDNQLEQVLATLHRPGLTRTTGKQLLVYASLTLLVGVVAMTMTRS